MTASVPAFTEKTWNGDGSTTAFPMTNVRAIESGDVKVWLIEDGTATLKTLGTHYTLSGLNDTGGFTVTFLTAPTADQIVKVRRDTVPKQTIDYGDLTKVPGDTTEQQLDRLAMFGQDINTRMAEVEEIADLDAIEQAAEDAAASAAAAEDWAIQPEDTPVPTSSGGDGATTYSSLHWAKKSEEFAGIATGVTPAADRTTLKALSTGVTTAALLKEAGREGLFLFRTGDYSTEQAEDDAEGVYLKADAIATTSGIWIRDRKAPLQADWFGIKGDDSTDNTAAFNDLLEYLAQNSGGRVFFPEGRVVLGAINPITVDNTHFVGQGQGLTTLVSSHATANLIAFGDGTDAAVENCSLQGMSLTANVVKTAGALIYLTNAYNNFLAHFRMLGTFHHGVSVNRANADSQYINTIYDFLIDGGEYGIIVGNDGVAADIVQELMVHHGTISNATEANVGLFNLSGGFFDTVSTLAGRCGWHMLPGEGKRVGATWFRDCLADTTDESGWELFTTGTGQLTDLFYTDCWASSCGTTTSHHGFFVGANSSQNIKNQRFQGLHATNCAGAGMLIEDGQVSISEGNVHANSQATSGALGGLVAGAGCDLLQVRGGRYGVGGFFADNTQSSGIDVLGAGTIVRIDGADVRNNVSAGISCAATDARIRDCPGFVTTNAGQTGITTDANGEADIAHGLANTPQEFDVKLIGDSNLLVQVVSVSSTNIRVRVYNLSNTDAASSSVTVYWRAAMTFGR